MPGHFYSSKLSPQHLSDVVEAVLKYSMETKKRGFVETVELQIGLKNYDPQRDKRFSGTIRLPKPCKPRVKFCIFGDQVHCDKAQELGLDFRDIEMLKTFNRNKKLVKKLGTPLPCSPPFSLGIPLFFYLPVVCMMHITIFDTSSELSLKRNMFLSDSIVFHFLLKFCPRLARC